LAKGVVFLVLVISEGQGIRMLMVRKAHKEECRSIAEQAIMAGEGIPAFFWAQSAQPHEDLIQVGAQSLLNEAETFSYRNVHVAEINGAVAGMMLAYRLPDEDGAEDLDSLPEFIRQLVELEQSVPGSFYINMLATFPEFRG
jgi:hypothetical protein